jgi:hypothetical protein
MQSLTHNFTSKIKFKPFNGWLKIASLVVLLVFGSELSAQNLVINSSFEKYSSCPTTGGQMWKALTVSSPPGNQAEYFNSCSTHPWLSVPDQGGYNYQEAHFGEAYVGVWLLNGPGHREYVQMEMFAPLVNSKYYNVEFWTNRASGAGGGAYAVNNAALAFKSTFTDTSSDFFAYNTAQIGLFNTIPDIVKYTNPIITDTANWVKINGVYKADGTENFLVIGNFFQDYQTDTLDMNDDPISYYGAYYFFDDVVVEEITQPFWQYHDTTVYYGDSVLIGPALTGLDIDWYTDNLDFISNAPGIYVTPPTSRDYIAKETFNGVLTEHVVHVTVIGGAGLEQNELQNVRVFPNPSKGSFSISGIASDKPLQLEVRDVHGKLVFEEKAFSKEANGFALDVENGIYFVTVWDLESKGFVVEKLVMSR